MVFPLDTVRKRLQVQGPSRQKYVGGHKTPVYDRGVVGTLKMIVRKEGTVGLYRGLSVSLVKAAPASAITMWTYERALDVIKKIQDEDK
jgi:solute carrier family 25 thiamine pyrophosphate transporter 19